MEDLQEVSEKYSREAFEKHLEVFGGSIGEPKSTDSQLDFNEMKAMSIIGIL